MAATAPNHPWREIRIPEQKEFDGVVFPLVLAPLEGAKGDAAFFVDAVRQHHDWLEDKCKVHGSIIFRGFPFDTPTHFDNVVTAFGYTSLPYLGGAAPRSNVVGGVFTANEAAPHVYINFHHEMAQNVTFPKRLFFWCETTPGEGGETPICLSHETYKRMKARFPQFVSDLETKGVKYTRYLPDGDDMTSPNGRGWQNVWQTTDRAEAERRCKAGGASCEWVEGGAMKITSPLLTPIREEARTKKRVWFNQVGVAHPEHGWTGGLNSPAKACTFADGTPLPVECLHGLHQVQNEIAVDAKWHLHDVMMVDNMMALHGRRPFKGNRRILAWLAA